MKVLFFITQSALMLFLWLNIPASNAQSNKCENRVALYMAPVIIESYDSTLHQEIRRQLKNYVISQQQAFNYLLVNDSSKADAKLILMLQRRFDNDSSKSWNRLVMYLNTIHEEADISKLTSIVVLQNSRFGKPSENNQADEEKKMEHPGPDDIGPLPEKYYHPENGGLLPWLQEAEMFTALFETQLFHNSHKDYRLKEKPDKIVLLKPFESSDQSLLAHATCLEHFLLRNMKESLASTPRFNVNIGFANNPPPFVDGVPVVYLETELIPQGKDRFEIVCKKEDGEKLASSEFSRKLLDKGLYRPFISYWIYSIAWKVVNP